MARGRAGSDIDLDAGASASKLPAYHAVPAAGRGRGVLVLGETGALDDFARDVCDRLARAGFAALAPDAGGAGAGRAAIEAGVRALLDDDATDGPRLGGLGFAQGGVRLLAAAAAQPRIGCLVSVGGLPEVDANAGDGVALPDVPTLLLVGEEDEVADGARALEPGLGAVRLRWLAGAGSGFMNPARADRFVAAATDTAWDATLAFLGASL